MILLYLDLQAVVLHQADVERRRPALRPLQHQADRLAGLGREAVGLGGCVQSLLRHGPVRRPLPTGDGDQAALAGADDVVPADGLRVFGAGVGDQGTDAAPRCQHVSSPHCEHPTHTQL